VGVRKIMELEDELAAAFARIRELEQALERARTAARGAVSSR
jgi:hypothetical protein